MHINEVLKESKQTRYALSQDSGVPYSTVSDIFSGKSDVEKCTAETLYRLSQKLDMTMEELYLVGVADREFFEEFRGSVRDRVSKIGYAAFITETVNSKIINKYWEERSLRECLYLLGMLDFSCRMVGMPLYSEYDKMRGQRINKPLFPAAIIDLCEGTNNDKYIKETVMNEAIPELMRFNIVEFD